MDRGQRGRGGCVYMFTSVQFSCVVHFYWLSYCVLAWVRSNFRFLTQSPANRVPFQRAVHPVPAAFRGERVPLQTGMSNHNHEDPRAW